MAWVILNRRLLVSGGITPVEPGDFLLQETGDFLLLEDGFKIEL